MKKISAFILAVVMVASILSTCLVATSAAGNELLKGYDQATDGERLYQVKFGQTDGVFMPTLWKTATKKTAESITTVFSDNNRTLTITNEEAKAKAYYGGAFNGLELGEGKNYTLTMKVNFGDTANAGVFFNHPKTLSSTDSWLHEDQKLLRGYYGTPDIRSSLCYGGDKMTGKYIASDHCYTDANWGPNPTVLFAEDANGFHDVTLEVEGFVFRVYINNTLYDEGTLPKNTTDASLLGFNVYVYNKTTCVVKDIDVYKGAIAKLSAAKPEYVNNFVDNTNNPNSTNKLLADYATAKDGDLLYAVNFNGVDGAYAPQYWDNYHSDDKVTADWKTTPYCSYLTSDNGNEITFTHEGFNANVWWGGQIKGLDVTPETKYTLEYKVKNFVAGKNIGLGYVTSYSRVNYEAFNFYGTWSTFENSNPTVVIEKGTSKIVGEVTAAGSTYTPIFPVYDADGYAHIKVEVDGYHEYIYYLYDDGEGNNYWKLFESYDMTEDLKYSDPTMACTFYIHNGTANASFKDVKVYKGLTVDKTIPEVTTPEVITPEVTTPEVTTPEATTPADTTAAPTTTAPAAEEKGCGSVVVGGIAVLAIVSLAGVAVSKKH